MSVLGVNPPGSNAHGDELAGNPPLGPSPGGQDHGVVTAQPAMAAPGPNASGAELAPLGIRPQDEVQNSAQGDAAWVAAQAAGAPGPTRTGVPYETMNHGGQPQGGSNQTPYDDYKHSGAQ